MLNSNPTIITPGELSKGKTNPECCEEKCLATKKKLYPTFSVQTNQCFSRYVPWDVYGFATKSFLFLLFTLKKVNGTVSFKYRHLK